MELFDEYLVFKLDKNGNFTFSNREELIGKPFIHIFSYEDVKKAANFFIRVKKEEKGKEILRIKCDNVFKALVFKMIRKENEFYGVGKEIYKEEPSFVTDFLGNVKYAGEKFKEIVGKNIFDIYEREKLSEIVEKSIEKGEYVGKVFVNGKDVRLRVKATDSLEFFIEPDFYKIIDEIFLCKSEEEIFEKIKEALDSLGIKHHIIFKDFKETKFPIYKDDKIVANIEIYEDIGNKENMVKFLCIAASNSIKNVGNIGKILADNLAFYEADKKGNILHVNKKFERLTGYKHDEMVGKNLNEIAEKRNEFLNKIRKGYIENFISKWRGKSKEFIACEYAWKIGNKIIAIIYDITKEVKKEKEIEFYNYLLRHDIYNKNEIALGYIGLLEKTKLNKRQKEIIEKVRNAIYGVNRFIENVGKAEEIEMARIKPIPVNIKNVVEKLCSSFGESASKRDIKIDCNIDNISVFGDEFIGEIFSNLIKNAIEHANCKNIKIYGEKRNEFYVVYVEDDGKGIDKKDIPKIFEMGWRRGGGGGGIGLYIVKKLMERYGGKVLVESEKGKGTRFILYFKLPQMDLRIRF